MRRRTNRRVAGFILIWGHRALVGDDVTTPVQGVCPVCGQKAVFRGRSARRWFTLFFVPVFPLGGAQRFCECMSCGQQLHRTTEQLVDGAAFVSRPGAFAPREGPAGDNVNAQAMRTHHEMLAHPDDPAILLRLIHLYAAMDEPSDARAACRAFPVAFAADPACAAALAAIA